MTIPKNKTPLHRTVEYVDEGVRKMEGVCRAYLNTPTSKEGPERYLALLELTDELKAMTRTIAYEVEACILHDALNDTISREVLMVNKSRLRRLLRQ